MRIFIILGIFFVSAFSLANAQTTLSAIVVDGQQYDITYRNSVVFDDYETTIDDAPWWNASNATANSFASAVYNANNSNNNIRFAHKTASIFGTDALYASEYASGTSLQTNVYAQNASGNYAIGAVAVPAPLPILGILPVVGFLKRMRKRQRA